MATQQALVLHSFTSPLSLETRPIPAPTPGSAIIRVLATHILPYQRQVFNAARPVTLILPLVPGNACIGRIEAVGSDAVSLSPGKLVFADIAISARDSPTESILMGLHGGSGSTTRLMDGEWRDSTFAEYAKFPLENLNPLNEELLLGKLGYSISDLIYIPALMVPFGGLASIDLQVGETIIVAPATGRFGGAAVDVAIGMGARVIAAGRNVETLKKMAEVFGGTGRFESAVMTGDGEIDSKTLMEKASGGADAYLDFSPGTAAKSSHIVASLGALRRGGRAVFMGGIMGNVEIPYAMVMRNNLRIHGRFMYERRDIPRLIRMVELGMVKLGKNAGISSLGPYGLKDVEDALSVAEENATWGTQVVLTP